MFHKAHSLKSRVKLSRQGPQLVVLSVGCMTRKVRHIGRIQLDSQAHFAQTLWRKMRSKHPLYKRKAPRAKESVTIKHLCICYKNKNNFNGSVMKNLLLQSSLPVIDALLIFFKMCHRFIKDALLVLKYAVR